MGFGSFKKFSMPSKTRTFIETRVLRTLEQRERSERYKKRVIERMYIVVNHQGWSTKNVALAVIFQKYYSSDVFSLSFSKLKFVKTGDLFVQRLKMKSKDAYIFL